MVRNAVFAIAPPLRKVLLVGLAAALLALPGPAPAERSLAGRLLVATPQLSDPNFAQSVVYLLQHDASGALGLVVNRPMGQVPLDRLLGVLQSPGDGEIAAPPEGAASGAGVEVLVYSGGPVEPQRAFTLHSRDVKLDHSVPVDANTAFNVQAEPLYALAAGAPPANMIFLLGYAGWGPGQLDEELARGDWYPLAADPSLLFSGKPEETWRRAIASYGTDL